MGQNPRGGSIPCEDKHRNPKAAGGKEIPCVTLLVYTSVHQTMARGPDPAQHCSLPHREQQLLFHHAAHKTRT